jgi:SAM-dependent methyltransferase
MSADWNSIFIEYSADKKKKLKRDLAIIDALDVTGQNKSANILELFCGKGECQELLQGMGFAGVYGLDISKALLGYVKQNVNVQACDSLNICYKSDTFDIVFINEGLHHLHDMFEIERCFMEVKRVLKNGGLFAFYEPDHTLARSLASALVLSPLSFVSRRTRLLKSILLDEMQEYRFWLSHIPEVLQLMRGIGFHINKQFKTPIHTGVVTHIRKGQ